MSDHYDDREGRSTADREADLFRRLAGQIRNAKDNAPYFADLFAAVDPDAVADRAALATLPVTRKSSLVELQTPEAPLGGLATMEPGRLRRVFQSPGPTYDAEGHGADWWRFARPLHAIGLRAGDLVHNAFAYHFTPAGMMVEGGAQALGCAVFPAGAGNTDLQVQAIQDLKPAGYVGAPSFLKIILERADEQGKDLSALRYAMVGAEPFLADQRRLFADRGIAAGQVYASADLGCIAYETPAGEGMVVDEDLIVEIVRPGTGDAVPEGEVGEVVVTTFAPEYPLIRFATGDLSAVLPGASPCGRTNMRLKGWMGRADQTTKVKGMFVHPAQVAEIVRRHPEIAKARLVVDRDGDQDVMTLRYEGHEASADLAAAVAETIQAVCKLKGRAEAVAPGSLPNDGKVIEDARSHE